MAESPSHRFGQIIGNLLEDVVRPFLAEFAEQKGLYLDHQTKTRKARKGKKVTWRDSYGNEHDLDYVLEREGSDTARGTPIAFVEVAWRRYTKHSRNKVQEIQGAIIPLAEKFEWSNPFLGAVLAGVFTRGSLDQLQSLGFQVLYFPYDTLVDAFASVGVDIAFDERTPDVDFRRCVAEIERLPPGTMDRVKQHLIDANRDNLSRFLGALARRIDRTVHRVVVIPTYGESHEFTSIRDAIGFIDQHERDSGSTVFRKYELIVEFTNGDRVEGAFQEMQRAREFLEFVVSQ